MIVNTPVGYGYDYFANPASFLSRLKSRPVLDVKDKISVSQECETKLFIETTDIISKHFTPFSIQDTKDGQYRLFPACMAGGFKLMKKYIETPVYKKRIVFRNGFRTVRELIGIKREESTKEKYAYTHLVLLHKKARHSFQGNITESFNPIFKNDLMGSEDAQGNFTLMSPRDFRNKYGTHVITDALTGGLVEMFIVTERLDNESCSDVKRKINYIFHKLCSGSTCFDDVSQMGQLTSRSTFTFRTIGGKILPMSNFVDFFSNYPAWTASLDEPQYQVFCGLYEGTFNSSCVPLSSLPLMGERKLALRNLLDREMRLSNPIWGPALHSELGSSCYREKNNDMVTALTQYSINQTMKSYINKAYQIGSKRIPTIAVYVLEKYVRQGKKLTPVSFYLYEDTDVEKELPEGFPEELRCKDLYLKIQSLDLGRINSDIDSQTEQEIENLDKAKEKYFVKYVVLGEFGFPAFFTQDDIAQFKPIVLDTDNPGIVHYTHCFKQFRIIELSMDESMVIPQIFDQNDEKKAWMYNYKVSLKISDGSKLDSLDDESIQLEILKHFKLIDQRKEWKDLSSDELNKLYAKIDDMYAMSQLVLDLDTLSLVSQPRFSFVDSGFLEGINEVISKILKQTLHEKLVLGRTFTENRNRDNQYAVIPLEYEYSVTPGPDPSDDDLNTLNYVINLGGDCNNSPVVPLIYNWKWVGEGRKYLQAGVSVINRQTIFNMILSRFEQSVIKKLCLQTKARIDGGVAGGLNWITALSESSSIPTENRFRYNQNDCYVYGKNTSQEWGWTNRSEQRTKTIYVPPFFAATCGLKVHYYMSAKAFWGHTAINGESIPTVTFDVNVRTYTDVAWNGGHNEGVVYNHQLKCVLALSIDEQGNIKVIPTIHEKDLNTYFNRNAWSQFCSLSLIDGVSNNVINESRKAVSKAIEQFKSNFSNAFDLGAGWVLPGHGKFSFTNERFTQHGDLAVDINYFEE